LAAVRTARALASGHYDVVHLHEPFAPSVTIAGLLARSDAPIVGTFHAAGDRTPYRWADGGLRRLAARIDKWTAVSPDAAQLVRRHFGRECDVLFNGIDATVFTPARDTLAASRTILFLGRHEPRKGLAVLLRAMQLLPADVTLLVAGDGPDRAHLQTAYADDRRIQWLGRVTDGDKIGHLRAASTVCVPSVHGESFGIVLLEAMAVGTPVVASDLPGYRALVADGTAALLVPPGDHVALAAALQCVLDDPAGTDLMRARGIVQARSLSLDSLTRRYTAIYDAVVGSVPRRLAGEPSCDGQGR
jgi:phosphatidyl-myo-inositol alpha-mannosyltransferase